MLLSIFLGSGTQILCMTGITLVSKVSLLGVDSLWGDCMFIPADLGNIEVDLYYYALYEHFSL